MITKVELEHTSKCNLSAKLKIYNIVKGENEISPYILDSNLSFRQKIAKLRLSDHKLEIEVGRFSKTIRSRRVCKLCNLGIEDVPHFLFTCEKYREERQIFLSAMSNVIWNFCNLSTNDKLKSILNPTEHTRVFIAQYLTTCFKKRELLCESLID